MANTRSDLMANILADPVVANDPNLSHGRLRVKMAEVVSAATDGANHIYVLARMKAHDHLLQIWVNSDAAEAGLTDCDFGVFAAGDWTAADQAVPTGATDDGLADGIDLATAATANADEVLGTGTNAVAETLRNSPLWEMASVTTEPARGTEYDICMTSNGDPDGVGTVSVMLVYTAGD